MNNEIAQERAKLRYRSGLTLADVDKIANRLDAALGEALSTLKALSIHGSTKGIRIIAQETEARILRILKGEELT
jgi:hypothetical protein